MVSNRLETGNFAWRLSPLARAGAGSIRRAVLAAAIASLIFSPASISSAAQDSGDIPGFAPAHAAAERQLEQKFLAIPDATHAENDLKRLTSEPHMAGTEASHRVALWLLDQYRSFGFDAELVSTTAWLPQPREIKLELVRPTFKRLATPEQSFDVDKDTYDKRVTPAFNIFSPSGEATAPVVYVNYGTADDYRVLAELGVSVEGKIVIVRYGRGFRGVKAKLAEEHKAAALIIYSDPDDDGYVVGDPYPQGPWRPVSGIQRGSILYTQMYPGVPTSPAPVAAAQGSQPAAHPAVPPDAANLPHIPTMPINAQDASAILGNLGGASVPPGWQGGLPFTYHVGPGSSEVHMKLVMDYEQRPLYTVIAKLHGTSDDEWVLLGNHHDAWVFGAADPGSGTAAMLETARSLGEMAKSGWRPRRTIVICEWDGEEPGLIGSTQWVEANRAELQAKAVAYINTDVGITGANFTASATPSLKELVRDATRQVADPGTGMRVYDAWLERAPRASAEISEIARQTPAADASGQTPLGSLGSGSDYSAFFDNAGIPSIDMAFGGDYGVYHSLYDDFYWMKRFGDPTFAYHAALARVLGTVALRLDEADVLPYDYPAYALEIQYAAQSRAARATAPADQEALKPVLDAAAQLSASATHAAQALHALSAAPLDPAKASQINRALAVVEQAFLSPDGLGTRPWYKHTIFAPGSYAGYAAETLPGITEALAANDSAALRRESAAVAEALSRASARLNHVARMAQEDASPQAPGQ